MRFDEDGEVGDGRRFQLDELLFISGRRNRCKVKRDSWFGLSSRVTGEPRRAEYKRIRAKAEGLFPPGRACFAMALLVQAALDARHEGLVLSQ